jgi:viroplasmin and RNaseH domain-containing protein
MNSSTDDAGAYRSEMVKECYVVFIGKVPGVYCHWPDTQAQVNGYSGTSHRGFDTRAEGENAYLRWTLKQERERNRHLKKYYIIALLLIPIALLSTYIMV